MMEGFPVLEPGPSLIPASNRSASLSQVGAGPDEERLPDGSISKKIVPRLYQQELFEAALKENVRHSNFGIA